jgi:hypothetical protein
MTTSMLRDAAETIRRHAYNTPAMPQTSNLHPGTGPRRGQKQDRQLHTTMTADSLPADDELERRPTTEDLSWIDAIGPEVVGSLAIWLDLAADQSDHQGTVLCAGHPASKWPGPYWVSSDAQTTCRIQARCHDRRAGRCHQPRRCGRRPRTAGTRMPARVRPLGGLRV